jgi:cytochrome c oxidase cbb3-type subunit III
MKLALRLALLLLLSGFAGRFVAAQMPPPPPRESPIPKQTPADLEHGKHLFEAHCAKCHGIDGSGGDGPTLRRHLSRGGDDIALYMIIRGGIPGTGMPFFWQLTDDEVWLVAGYVRSLGKMGAQGAVTGNAQKGLAVYNSSGCAGCHIVKGEGGTLGPELSSIGDTRGPDYLREALVNPGAHLPEQLGIMERGRFKEYLLVRVVTKDGHQVEGMRITEDSFSIQLRDVSGQLHSFRKLDLQSIEKEPGKSFMPSFKNTLSATQLDDLIAYLASLKGGQ